MALEGKKVDFTLLSSLVCPNINKPHRLYLFSLKATAGKFYKKYTFLYIS